MNDSKVYIEIGGKSKLVAVGSAEDLNIEEAHLGENKGFSQSIEFTMKNKDDAEKFFQINRVGRSKRSIERENKKKRRYKYGKYTYPIR